MPTRKFSFRNEEMPVVGGFLLKSFELDFAEFEAFSPDFNESYKLRFKTKLELIDSIINPKKIQSELKKITENMYASSDGLRSQLQLLEGYINRAENLTILPKDFGISAIRKKLTNKDQESLLENLKILIQNIDDNLTAIQEKGFTTAAYNKLKASRDSIKNYNQGQNEKMNQKQKLVEENIEVFNELWAIMSDVMDTGKRISKNNIQLRIENYTIARLKKRVRNERPKIETVSEPTIETPK